MPRSSTTFQKGDKGNPKGRPAGYAAFRDACKEHTPLALKYLVKQIETEGADAGFATKLLLEYGWGKPSSAPEDIETAQQLVIEVVKLTKGEK